LITVPSPHRALPLAQAAGVLVAGGVNAPLLLGSGQRFKRLQQQLWRPWITPQANS